MDVGDKVIVRDNENSPAMIGTLKEFQYNSNKTDRLPVVTVNGTDFLCFSIVVPYTDELFKNLEMMSPKEAWHWLAKECQEKRIERIR